MKTTFSEKSIKRISKKLQTSLGSLAVNYPGEPGQRQPVHVVYGGAHLFRSDTIQKLGKLAMRAFETYAPDVKTFAGLFGIRPELAGPVYQLVKEKLAREAVEDFRIDFEDGYGIRSDEEEDGHAESAAREMAAGLKAGTLPPFTGFRIKSFSEETYTRAIRTLDIFLTALLEATGGKLPQNFVVTLPKIVAPEQVATLAGIFDELELKFGISAASLKMEMMIETTRSIIGTGGEIALPHLLAAARGRCTAAHFGAYDYLSSCGITAGDQDLMHPACDFARNIMQVSLAGTGVRLSDGATNIMPVGPHRGEDLSDEQKNENRAAVHRAWKVHYDHVRHSLANGFFQSWDLHPAQIVARYAAVYAFFLEGLDTSAERLRNFIDKAAQATLVGNVFDDAATGQGLLNYFLRAINCGALTEEQVLELISLTLEELRSGSFAKILENRKGL